MNPLQRLERRHWFALWGTLLAAFLILGFYGCEVYRQAPPIPERVALQDGTTLATREDILTGQQVWQSTGGQQLGSIWGHGAYQAPDWSADRLHRESVSLLELWSAREHGRAYGQLPAETQAALRGRLERGMRTNTYDPATGTVTSTAGRSASSWASRSGTSSARASPARSRARGSGARRRSRSPSGP